MRNDRSFANKGFTLIELMIVVVIIGVLAALAIPRYMAASLKSKQVEAKAILKQIYVNERTYWQQSPNQTYYQPPGAASSADRQAFAEIWIEIMPSARYTYTIVTNGGTSFLATATANIDDDLTIDTWTMDDQGNIDNPINDATS